MDLLDSVMFPGDAGASPCLLLSNDAGKRWVFEGDDLRTALNLYQPTASRGRAIKAVLPFIIRVEPFQKIVGLSWDKRALVPQLANLANELFDNDWSVSAFGGTPGDDQKVTLQFSRGGSILGYIKVCDKSRLFEMFAKEGKCLSELELRGVRRIPRCLFVGEKSGFGCFAQTCVKEEGYRTPTKLGEAHWDFLNQLYIKTAVDIDFAESDAFATLVRLSSACSKLSGDQREIVLRAIEDTKINMCSMRTFCACHGDFTPWNTALNSGWLSAFDFEYSRQTYPPYFDAMHFFAQVQLFVRRRNAPKIAKAFRGFSKEFIRHTERDPCSLMHFYLLSMIEQFLNRDNLDDVEAKNMNARIELLRLI